MMLRHCPALKVLRPSPPGTVEGDRQQDDPSVGGHPLQCFVLHKFISIGEGMKVRET